MESPDPFINLFLIILLEIMLPINIQLYVCQRNTSCSSHSKMTVACCRQNLLLRALQYRVLTYICSGFSKDDMYKWPNIHTNTQHCLFQDNTSITVLGTYVKHYLLVSEDHYIKNPQL